MRIRIAVPLSTVALLAALLWASNITPVVANDNNLVVNGSFEEIEGDRPRSFTLVRYAGDTLTAAVDPTVARTGTHSVRIDGDGTSRSAFRKRMLIEGGQTYRVSIWYRHDEDDGGVQINKTMLRLMGFDQNMQKVFWSMDWMVDKFEGEFQIAGGENLHIYAWQDAPNEWKSLAATFTLPHNVTTLDIEGFNWLGEGTVWFDDLSLIKLDDQNH